MWATGQTAQTRPIGRTGIQLCSRISSEQPAIGTLGDSCPLSVPSWRDASPALNPKPQDANRVWRFDERLRAESASPCVLSLSRANPPNDRFLLAQQPASATALARAPLTRWSTHTVHFSPNSSLPVVHGDCGSPVKAGDGRIGRLIPARPRIPCVASALEFLPDHAGCPKEIDRRRLSHFAV
jgi:hypothetical protein